MKITRVTIHGPKLDGISQVPASALQQNGAIWLVTADRTLQRHEPDILYSDSTTLALRGLPAGSVVVTSRISGASTGTEVTFGDDESEAPAAAPSL